MKKLKLLVLSLAVAFALCAAGCKDSPQVGGDSGADKSGMFGFFEPLWEKRGTSSEDQVKMFDLDVTIDLMEAMGCTSIRFYVPSAVFDRFIVDYETGDIEISLRKDVTDYFHYASQRLRAAGIKLLVGESIVYPPFTASNGMTLPVGSLNVPAFGTDDCYEMWLKAVEAGWKAVAEEFPEVAFWEMANETNTAPYFHPATYDPGSGAGAFSEDELVAANIDYMYYASRGIKSGNANAVSITPGFTSKGSMKMRAIEYFLTDIYAAIKSGEYPRVGEKSKNTNDYFGAVAYHPYETAPFDDKFVGYNNDIYKVMQDNGDGGKEVFFTEMGWFDNNNETVSEMHCGYIEKLYKYCMEDMPYVRSCLYFRFYNCAYDWSGQGEGNPEQTFGVFYEPTDTRGFAPKAKAETMKKIFGGKGDLNMWSDLDKLREKVYG